jgi:hypothetical protein
MWKEARVRLRSCFIAFWSLPPDGQGCPYPKCEQLHVWILMTDASFQSLNSIFGRDLLGANLVTDLKIQGQVLRASRKVL